MRDVKFLRVFLFSIICIVYLFSFSHLSVFAYEAFFTKEDSYATGTKIAGTDVSKLEKPEATSAVQTGLTNWQNTASFFISYKERKEALPMDVFEFDLEKTMDGAQSEAQNNASVNVNYSKLNQFLTNLVGAEELSRVSVKKLRRDLTNTAASLNSSGGTLHLEAYVPKKLMQKQTVSQAIIKLSDEQVADLSTWLTKQKKITIPGNTQFSLLANAKENDLVDFSNDSLSLLGSVLYEMFTSTNFEILERHTSRELPKWAQLGYEARILNEKLDLVLFNPNYLSYDVKLEMKNNELHASLEGEPFLYSYSSSVKDPQQFKPKIVVQYATSLLPGTRQTIESGENGQLVKVFREITWKGQSIKSLLLGEDFYPPVHGVELRGFPLPIESLPSSDDITDSESGDSASESDPATEDSNSADDSSETDASSEGDQNTEPSEDADSNETNPPTEQTDDTTDNKKDDASSESESSNSTDSSKGTTESEQPVSK